MELKILLAGHGEIGQALETIFSEQHTVWVIDAGKHIYPYQPPDKMDVLFVAFPCKEQSQFIEAVKEYQEEYQPEITIVFSTVPIGTCKKLNAFHSPIEGTHPNLEPAIRQHTRFIGGEVDLNTAPYIHYLFNPFEYVCFEDSRITEFAKLRSTTLYGIEIEYARYTEDVCKRLGIPYNFVMLYDKAYNDLHQVLEVANIKRSILYPPKGNIGGHCVVPNAVLLGGQFPHVFIEEILRDKESKK